MKRSLAGLLALLQFGWTFFGAPCEAIAGVVVQAQVQVKTSPVQAAPVPVVQALNFSNPSVFAADGYKLSAVLPNVNVGALPAVSGGNKVISLSDHQRTIAVETGHVRHPGRVIPLVRTGTVAGENSAETAAVAAKDEAGGKGLRAITRRVGKALQLKGFKATAGGEVSKEAADRLFSALRGSELIATQGTAGSKTSAQAGALHRGRAARVLLHKTQGQAADDYQNKPAVENADFSAAEAKAPSALARLWQKPAVRWAAALAAGAGIVAALPALAAHVGLVAGAGSIVLSVIGVPQIYKNFKEGRKAVMDVPVATPLIWFAAAVMFSVVSIGQAANPWWIGANLAGVLESILLIGQINNAQRSRKVLIATGLAMAAALLPLPFIALQAFMPLSSWLSLALTAALYLCWLINWPQIKSYYHLYKEDGRRPEGLSPLWPGLVALGSLLHLYAAVMLGDMSWVLNAVVAITASSTVLAQYYFPGPTNAVLGPGIRAVEGVGAFLKKAGAPLAARAASALIKYRKARYLPEARRTVSGIFKDIDYAKFTDGDLEQRLDHFVTMAEALPGRSLIYLQAPTAAGKSTLAKRLAKTMGERIKVFPVDSYFKNPNDVPRLADGSPDFDRPDALYLDRAAADIKALLEGRRVEMPYRNMEKMTTEFKTGDYMQLGKEDVLIVDSIFAAHKTLLKAGVGHTNLNVFLSAPTAARLARRLKRDKYERGRSIEDNLKGWERVLENEKKHIMPLRHHADYFIEMTSKDEVANLAESFAELLAEDWAEHGRNAGLAELFTGMIGQSVARDKLILSEAYLTADLAARLEEEGNPSYLSPAKAAELTEALDVSPEELISALRPIAAKKAMPSVSGRSVGAVGLGESGAVYLGGNIESYAGGIEVNIHAEQAVVINALEHGETGLKALAVTANPCGHCRAFLNELASRGSMKIIVESREKPATLAELYPMPYGDDGSLLTARDNNLAMIRKPSGAGADLINAAFRAANRSYSKDSPAGAALRTKDGSIYVGAYVEVRGHNPSLRPLLAALVALRADGRNVEDIVEGALVELKDAKISHRGISRRVLKDLAGAPLRTMRVRRGDG
ncbi:MAG: cytidine deaminase [Elusimicrobiota bacterium]